MARWRLIAGTAAMLAACGVQIAHSQLAIRKGEFLIASNAKIRAAEERQPKPEEVEVVSREQYLESSLAAERECRRLYAEQSFALDGYFIEQSYLMLAGWACLFATGLGLIVSSWRNSWGAAQRTAEPVAAADRGRS